MHEDAGGVARLPRRLGCLIPVDAIGGIPDVVAVALEALPLHHPEPTVEDRHLVILPRLPRCFLYVARPDDPVVAAPDVVVEAAGLRLRRVIGPTAIRGP